MCTSSLRISEAASLILRLGLLAVLLSNGFSCMNYSSESLEAAENSFLVSSRLTTRNSPKSLENESVVYVQRGELYADSILPRSSKEYIIHAPEGSLASFFLEIHTEEAVLDVATEGPVNRTRVGVVWLPAPHIYYVGNSSEIRFLITNPQTYLVRYSFYVDVSEPLGDTSSKALLLEGGKASFHIDLRKDDRVFLKLGSENQPELRIWIFVLYYQILPERTYMLRLYRKSLHETLYFTSDLGRRYYVIIDSAGRKGEFSLASTKYSPTWNQEWFWLAAVSGFLTLAVSLADISKIRKLEKPPLFALVSCYCWLVTVGLSVSVAGSFSYGTLIYMPLFHLLIIAYGLGHVLQTYATHLERKTTSRKCPYCRRGVDLQKVNYCCGRIVRNVSSAWFLFPFSLGLFLFIASYLVFERVPTAFLGYPFWAGSCGNILGGIIAWWINRKVYAIELWEQRPKRYYIPSHIPFVPVALLVTGIVFAFVSPLITMFLMEGFLTQHAESFLEAHAPWLRIRIAPLTISFNVVLWSMVVAVVSGLVLAYRIRRIFTRSL